MKVGFFGGLLLLGLTIIFAMIALQNNKIAREIAIKNFGLDKQAIDLNDTNRTKQQSDFDRKFEEFDKKFENF
ncbi:hypothetical protein [Hydrogenimonas thermophila]|uniref:Uncharacterized protein n=1 Tax=Hydrogenimonas thermophila TaxID=223786 RepID=A0A1I5LYB8_9BACT|nr:hypothetical protein [Hydrogenimonas thermophila]WOE70129.1 hypothetical protein RZR91_00775 [Hydrogenimonas thermophila]WOE72646.1 hypothetical protein RZR97_00775 [Hydrogenimonas thermophila]SFP02242.1 hypothetical protein SAMN05216234_10477 [Hydrogenimonas thermophila]